MNLIWRYLYYNNNNKTFIYVELRIIVLVTIINLNTSAVSYSAIYLGTGTKLAFCHSIGRLHWIELS